MSLDPANFTFQGALDKVVDLRALHRSIRDASPYKNVMVDTVDSFLKACVDRWGPGFMDYVKRDLLIERDGEQAAARAMGTKGRRRPVNGVTPEELADETGGRLFYVECLKERLPYRLWWKPNSRGYTAVLPEAGEYTAEEARALSAGCWDSVRPWPVHHAKSAAHLVVLI